MVNREPCLVCRGQRTIRLPLYRAASAVRFSAPPETAEETNRQYPCPECAPQVSEERVAVLKCQSSVITRAGDPGYEEHVCNSLAHDLVDLILRSGHITFTKGEIDERLMTHEMSASLGVISAASVASMEERIAERQMEVAAKLVGAAAEEIRVWGRHYSGDEGSISKGQAVDAVARAFRIIKERKP